MVRLLLFSLLLFNPVMLCSQSAPVFRHFGAEEGFPSCQVYQVLSDQAGVLWFATDQGLVSYNGYEFRTWSTKEGLTDNTVFKLQTGPDGVLWMQTFTGEIFRLKNEKVHPYRYNHVIRKFASGQIPQGFYIDSTEVVHFITSAMQEVKIDSAGNAVVVSSFAKTQQKGWIALHEVATGKFVSSGNSVISFCERLYLLYTSTEGSTDTLEVPHKENSRLSAIRLRDGTLLVCIGYYFYRYENKHLIECGKMPFLSNFLFEHSDTSLWLASFNGVVHFAEKNNFFSADTYLSDAFITGFCQDAEGTLWITTLNEGVYSLSSTIARQLLFDGNTFKEPLSVTAGNGKFYAAFWNGYVVQLSADKIHPIRKFPSSDFVSSVYLDTASDRLYIAKADPGYLINNRFVALGTNKLLAFKGRYLQIGNQQLLNPTATGLYWIGPNGIFKKMPFPFRLNDISLGPDNKIILSASDGVYSFDQPSGNYKPMVQLLKGRRIQTFAYHDQVMVIAVRGDGLWLKKGNAWYRLTTVNGLCSDFINKIIFYGNYCWCSSSNGISRFELSEVGNTNINIENFNSSNCLPENDINDILISNDTVWVASKNAICFFPVSLTPGITAPPGVTLTGVKVNNKPVSVSTSLSLPAEENNISVSFIGVSPSSKGLLYYRYLLISDRDTFESFTTNRQVDFPALKEGKYIFQVYARNLHQVWSVSPAGFQFVVHPPWWKRWWIIVAMVVVLVAGVYLIMKFRLQKVRREQEWKSDLERQLLVLESKALRAQMNPHFIFNVMNSIQDFILKSDIKSAQKYLTKFARLVRMILDNSLLPEVLLDEELKANRLYVELEQQRFHQKFDFVFEIDDDLEESGIRIPSMLIQPFLENAIKHGISHLEGTGRLRLSVKRKNQDLVLEVEDNGVGRKAAAEWNALHQKEHQSMGSMLTEKRVEILNATLHTRIHLEVIDLLSDDGKPAGTLIRMIFPAVAAHMV